MARAKKDATEPVDKKPLAKQLNALENAVERRLAVAKKVGFADKKKLVSFVIPAYNEEENLEPVYLELAKTLELPVIAREYDFEIVFVDDGSTDGTWNEIVRLGKLDGRVKWVNFSRNFGKEIALSAGLEFASGSAVITMDADGQHPVEKIPEFLSKWQEGYDIVYNMRPKTAGASLRKNLSSKLFYTVYNSISTFKLEEGITDYRLVDRKVVNVFLGFREKNRIYRGIIDFVGFKKASLIFDARKRLDAGPPRYDFKKLAKLSLDTITAFSVQPLKFGLVIGGMGIACCFVTSLALMADAVFGLGIFESKMMAALLLGNGTLLSLTLISLGLVGIYVGSINEEVKRRPLYIVREASNLETDSANQQEEDFRSEIVAFLAKVSERPEFREAIAKR